VEGKRRREGWGTWFSYLGVLPKNGVLPGRWKMHQESYVPITFLTTTVPGKSTPNRKHQLVHVLEKDRWIVRLVVFSQRQLISMPMITMTTSNSSKVNPAARVAN
jgi:hypothetical protein